MNFTINSKLMQTYLSKISGIISTNTVLSVLEDFYFELKGNTLTARTTDLETTMQIAMEVQMATGEGGICIPAKILLDYLKALAEQPIDFAIDPTSLAIKITSEKGIATMTGENSGDFPKAPSVDNTTSIGISAAILNKAIAVTAYCTSVDTLRPQMTGVFFQVNDGTLHVVATDAHRLSDFEVKNVQGDNTAGFIIPKKAIVQFKNIVPNDETIINISYNQSHVFIQTDIQTMSCRLIDARFPDYKSVIPVDNPYTLTINRADFLGSLRRISVFANKTTNQVVLDIKGTEVFISAQDIDFSYEGKERLSCDYKGEDIKIAFNAKLLLEILNNLSSIETKVQLSTPTRAGIFKESEQEENQDHLVLLMPLMVGV